MATRQMRGQSLHAECVEKERTDNRQNTCDQRNSQNRQHRSPPHSDTCISPRQSNLAPDV